MKNKLVTRLMVWKPIVQVRIEIPLILTLLFLGQFTAQGQVLSLQDVLQISAKSNLQIRTAQIETKKGEVNERTAFNLPSPQLQIEAPTGDFFTLGFQQNFDFPTTYFTRGKLLRLQTKAARLNQSVTVAEMNYYLADLYLKWQVAESKVLYYKELDSLYREVSLSADREFEVGQIDFVERSFAQLKSQDSNRRLELARAEVRASKSILLNQLGLEGDFSCLPMEESVRLTGFGKVDSLGFYSGMAKAQLEIDEHELKLRRQLVLPGFYLGYKNQGDRNSDQLYRLNAGLSIPLWWWQHSSSIMYAKLNIEQGQIELSNARLKEHQMYNSAFVNYTAALNAIMDLRMTSLPASHALIEAADRMFEVGEISFTEYLRLHSEASDVHLSHIELMQNLLQYQNQLTFITTTL